MRIVGFPGIRRCQHRSGNRERRGLTRKPRARAPALPRSIERKSEPTATSAHELRTPRRCLLAPVEDSSRRNQTTERGTAGRAARGATKRHTAAPPRQRIARSREPRGRTSSRSWPNRWISRGSHGKLRARSSRRWLPPVCTSWPTARRSLERRGIDRNAWETIVLNLLSNALNYTRRGAVTLRLGAVDDRVRLVISDTGAGIPPAVLPHIFDRFYRSPKSGARSVEGTGLGLSLVREFARALGGDVGATSTPNEGSTFTVEVPFEHAGSETFEGDERTAPHERLPSSDTQLDTRERAPFLPETIDAGRAGRPRVLVVEDNPDMRQYLARVLARDYEVHAVPDGNAALVSLPTFRPDLVLSDVLMPGVDGSALMRALRSVPDTRSIPAILITARTGEDATLEGLRQWSRRFHRQTILQPRAARAGPHTHRARTDAARCGGSSDEGHLHRHGLARTAHPTHQHQAAGPALGAAGCEGHNF